MLASGMDEEKRSELDHLLDGSTSGLVDALVEEGVDIEIARLRERINRSSDIEEKARLRIEMMTKAAQLRAEQEAADG